MVVTSGLLGEAFFSYEGFLQVDFADLGLKTIKALRFFTLGPHRALVS